MRSVVVVLAVGSMRQVEDMRRGYIKSANKLSKDANSRPAILENACRCAMPSYASPVSCLVCICSCYLQGNLGGVTSSGILYTPS